MHETLVLDTTVSYRDVERTGVLSLPAAFKLLQEAAIRHADQFDVGARAMRTRGESWILSRILVRMERYPAYEEPLRVETWSTGIRSFKGFREFRLHDRQGATILSGSSLWLYVSLRSKAIARVPRELADAFPVGPGAVFCPDLEQLAFAAPAANASTGTAVTLRYADVDGNGHLNNTVYVECVQTALARAGLPAQPRQLRLKYQKEIPATADNVTVRLEPRTDATTFSIEHAGSLCAVGEVA